MAWTDAQEGQRAVEMGCACRASGTLVRIDRANNWRCGVCSKGWPANRTFLLGRKGAIPAPPPVEVQLTADDLRSLTCKAVA